MPTKTEYTAGTPSWVDIGLADVEAGTKFYADLFGWDVSEEGPEESGGYRMFTQEGKSVAGAGPLQMEGQPSVWTTYITVDDADAVALRVAELGGQTLVDPMDVMDAGRMAIFMDTAGAAFAIWQPKAHIGAELVNEPVSLTWNELITTDVAGAEKFYSELFGWTYRQFGEMESYKTIHIGDSEDAVGGMMPKPEQMPAEVPAHWGVYFSVDDPDATVAKLKELGGSVMMEPMDMPPGRMAAVADPGGAPFQVIKNAHS